MNTIKIKNSLILVVCFALFFASCKEDEIMTYKGETNVYFSLLRWRAANQITYTITDFEIEGELYPYTVPVVGKSMESLSVSLEHDGTDEGYHVQLIPVSIIGDVVDYDRPLSYLVEPGATAVEGKHFTVVAKIPANKNIGALAVLVDRKATLDSMFNVTFRLIPNEHFSTNYSSIARSPTDTTKVCLQKFDLEIINKVSPPKYWDSHYKTNYLGTFSIEKLFLIVELSNIDPLILYALKTDDIDTPMVTACGKLLKQYILEQAAKGITVMHIPYGEEEEVPMDYGARV